MLQPTIREENGGIMFDWGGGLSIEAASLSAAVSGCGPSCG